MFESTERKSNSRRLKTLVITAALVLALAAWLVCQFAVGKEKLGFSPIWMLFIVFFLGAGLFNFVYGILKKNAVDFVLGGAASVCGLTILLLCLLGAFWWVAFVVAVVLIVALVLSTFLLKAPVVEQTMEFDNAEDAGRKSYEERKAELEERKAAERKAEADEVLPEIKSFKD